MISSGSNSTNVTWDDPWSTQGIDPHDAISSAIPTTTITRIDDVEPLDEQIGISPKRSVPVKLQNALFGQLEDKAAGLIVGRDQPLYTYAILDAAKIPSLAEAIENSGLKHRCLFIREAYASLKDVAPWIVQLEEGNRFVRNLFTRSNAGWHLWDSSPGLYIRSPVSLDELWKHFRKFTRVRDESGKWFYQRFWEPEMLKVYAGIEASPFAADKVTSVIATGKDKAHVFIPPRSFGTTVSPLLTDTDRLSHVEHSTRIYSERLARKLHPAMPRQMQRLEISDLSILADSIFRIGGVLARFDITRAADVARLAACGLFYGTYFLNDPRILPLVEKHLRRAHAAASVRALRFEEALRKQPRHDSVTTDTGLTQLIEILTYLERGRSLPALPAALSGIDTDAVRESFLARCRMSWQRAGLPMDEVSSRRSAQTAIALLWGPEFLQDPLHQSLAATLIRSPSDDISAIICRLRQRTEDC